MKTIRLLSSMSVLTSPASYRENSFEHCLTYDRKDGKRVEMALTHVPDVSGEGQHTPLLQIATHKIRKNPNCTLNEHLAISIEEARLLRDFLLRPEVQNYLEDSGE